MPSAVPIVLRVVMVSPCGLLAAGLHHILARRPVATLIAVGSTIEDAVELTQMHKPDIVLIDLDVTVERGRRSLAMLQRICPRGVFLGLAGSHQTAASEMFVRAELGVLIARSCGASEFLETLDRCARGRRGEPPVSRRSADMRAGLTRRQHAALQLVARGFSNREIAAELRLSEGTVKRHLYNASRAISANGRVDAVNRARALGYEL